MGWSYTQHVKSELTQLPLSTEGCMIAELWGMMGDVPHVLDTGFRLSLGTARVVRRAFHIMKNLKLEPKMRVVAKGQRLRYQLLTPHKLSGNETPCVAGYLRGLFLSHGYLANPERQVHLEMGLGTKERALFGLNLLKISGIRARLIPRRNGYVLYLKDKAQVIHFLALIGAYSAILKWESLGVVRSMKNQINRLVNSETANLKRTVESGTNQAERLRVFMGRKNNELLTDTLFKLAELRMKHPDWSLVELGEAFNPPLSKSAINHRMRKLMKVVEQDELTEGSGETEN